MSKLSYRIQQASDETTVLQKIKTIKFFFMDLYYDYPEYWWSSISRFYKNFKFFLPHIINMRSWDYSDQLYLFADSLEYLAKELKNGQALLAEKQYRIAMTAAGKIRKAYSYEAWNDPSYRNWVDRNPRIFVDIGDGYRKLETDFKDSKEYSDKMFKLIHARQEKEEKALQKDCWEYIHKHIQQLWD